MKSMPIIVLTANRDLEGGAEITVDMEANGRRAKEGKPRETRKAQEAE